MEGAHLDDGPPRARTLAIQAWRERLPEVALDKVPPYLSRVAFPHSDGETDEGCARRLPKQSALSFERLLSSPEGYLDIQPTSSIMARNEMEDSFASWTSSLHWPWLF